LFEMAIGTLLGYLSGGVAKALPVEAWSRPTLIEWAPAAGMALPPHARGWVA
jgi:hypothetical protein